MPEVKSNYTKLTRVRGETTDNLFPCFIQETRTRRNLRTGLHL